MRLSPIALLLAALLAVPALHASPISYQMTFTSGSHSGTGTLTLASQPASSGVTIDTIANRQLRDLTFTVARQTFDFSADPSASVQFVNGQVSRITFGQIPGQTPASYTVEFSSGFSLYRSDLDQPLVSGNYTVTPALASGTASTQPATTGPTPEPGTLLLLATALLGGVFFVFRRSRTTH